MDDALGIFWYGRNQLIKPGNRNANDAIAFAQTVEGGLDEITNMLQRIRTLAVQANNGINTAEDKTAINNEANELTAEITRIAKQTTYGGKNILAGGSTGSIYSTRTNPLGGSGALSGDISFQIGSNSGDTISIKISDFTFENFAKAALSIQTAASLVASCGFGGTHDAAGDKLTFDLEKKASSAIASIDKMLSYVDTQRSALGSIQNRLESTIRVQSNVVTNESDARSRIRDTDFAEESANLSQQSIIQQAATSMLMQANARPQIGLSLLG